MATLAKYNPNIYLRKLYDWVMKWADHPQGVRFLALLAFVESIFFPIPVDPFIIAMGTAKAKKALWYGMIASLCSVFGGAFGYLLGFMFWDVTGEFFFHYIISEDKFALVMEKFNDNAFWSMFLAGFTPIPFKVFTIAAGVAKIDLLPFFFGSLISRSLRFCFIGSMLYFYGSKIRSFIESYFEKITLGAGIIIVLILVVYQAAFV